MSGYSGGSALM